MATTNKGLAWPDHGGDVDFWDTAVNNDFTIIDQAFGGVTSLNATSGSATLSVAQYRSLILSVTGAISSDVVYTFPAGVGGFWVVNNATTSSNGSRVIFASGGGGATQTAPRGAQTVLSCNGTDVWLATAVGTSVPTGGGTDTIFYNNGQTVTSDYTVPTSNNSGSFGPITVNSGVTVTVPPGSTWSVV
jgi:hypothetical protein